MFNAPVDFVGRNTVWGFRNRVVKNLEFIATARNTNADVHIVTELITSLLGLIVFPYQEIVESEYESFKDRQVDDLTSVNPSIWHFSIGSSENLHDHVRHLRNAISHRRIHFSNDDRDLARVEVRFQDRATHYSDVNWEVTVTADALKEFVCEFAALLQDWERDYS
jgi:hypothetical protein